MQKKIALFFKLLWIFVFVIGVMIIITALTMTSLEVQCDLQIDQSYTCQSRDTILGVTLSEVKAEQVSGIEQDLTCGGAGKNKGCSAHAEFLTTTGERIILSKLYTNTDLVQKAVNTIEPLMTGKSTPIDILFPPSTFVSVVMISVASCVFIILIFIALISLFGKDAKDLEAQAIDLRKKD